jgi:recombination protein RecT
MTAQTVTQAVEKREAGIVNVMWDRKTHFAAVLPDHVDVKSFLGTAAAALYGNAELMKAAEASPDSLITALMRCAALGHQPGTDEFYLTPRKVQGRPSVLGIEGYRGIVERMYRSGAVKTVIVREVCAKDKFKFVEGEMDKPLHAAGGGDPYNSNSTGADFFGATGSRDRGAMVGVYAYAILTTGAVSRVAILNRDDVHAARDAGGWKADDRYSPWNRADGGAAHPELTGRSMWWKTAARRLEPWVPTSAEYRREQLRAAASAHEAVAMRPVQPVPAGNGYADIARHAEGAPAPADPGPAAPDETPASGPAAGPGPAKPSKAAMDKLTRLLQQLPLGDGANEVALIEWLTGHPVDADLTKADVATVTSFLEDALDHAGGDPELAASRIWEQHRDATGQTENP